MLACSLEIDGEGRFSSQSNALPTRPPLADKITTTRFGAGQSSGCSTICKETFTESGFKPLVSHLQQPDERPDRDQKTAWHHAAWDLCGLFQGTARPASRFYTGATESFSPDQLPVERSGRTKVAGLGGFHSDFSTIFLFSLRFTESLMWIEGLTGGYDLPPDSPSDWFA